MQAAARSIAILVAVLALVGSAAGPAAATIGQPSWTLNVSKVGSGLVSGSGTGWSIDCGAKCSDSVDNSCAYDPDVGQPVCDTVPATVSATGQNGYTFQSWSGCDQVSGADCTVSAANSATVTATFRDSQAPSIGLAAPSAGVKTHTFAIAANASDNDAVSIVYFFVRGAPVGSDTTAPYSINFDSTTVADGSAAVTARAVDPAGNTSTTASVTVTIDNTAPNLGVIDGPGAGPFGPGTTQNFSWTVDDGSGSGVSHVWCRLDNGSYGACATDTTMSYSGLPDGPHTLTVQATDNAGNAHSRSYNWSIDAVAPVAQFTSGPADGSSSADTSAAYTFAASEPATFQCRFYAATDAAPAFAPCSGPDSFSVAGLSPGTYVLDVMPTDSAGNAGTAIKRSFTVNPPTQTQTSTSTGDGSGTTAQPQTPAPAAGSPAAGKPAIAAALRVKWSVKRRQTRARSFRLAKLPARASIRVTCKAKRKKDCPFKSKRFKSRKGALNLTRRFRKPLGAGTRITITITAPGMSGQRITLTTRTKKRPKQASKQLS